MSQISQFLLVVVGVAVAALWALLRKRSGKWLLLIVGSFVAWLVLPSVILQVKWGYYEEDGVKMAHRLESTFQANGQYQIKKATDLAKEVCGNAEDFDVADVTLQTIAMPEQAAVEHFFYYGKYANVIWLGVGWKDRFCLARYLVANRKDGYICTWPTQLFPYPFFPWLPHTTDVEERLIERLSLPVNTSEGVRPLLPGQCVTGEIAKGNTLRFQVQIPNLDQKIGLDVHLECIYVDDRPKFVGWTKNGHPVAGERDESDVGGTYEIALQAPATETKRYAVGVYWGVQRLGCPLPKDWWGKCARIVNPKAADGDPK
jgi:hypothetical protein